VANGANDNMMTIDFSWGGVLLIPYLVCVLSWAGWRKSPVVSRGKPPVGGLDWGRIPRSSCVLINFKPVI